jgi:hypothetical protein
MVVPARERPAKLRKLGGKVENAASITSEIGCGSCGIQALTPARLSAPLICGKTSLPRLPEK